MLKSSVRSLTIPDSQGRLKALTGLRNTYGPWNANLGTSVATFTLTSGGASDTTGSWVEIYSSTEADIYELDICLAAHSFQGSINSSSLVEIGIGSSGAETTIIPYLQFGHVHTGFSHRIPIFIPVGTRVAARVTCAVASRTVTLAFHPRTDKNYWKPANYCLSYGVVLSSSRGTVLTIPGSTNTKGAWTELTPATTERLSGLIICQGSGSNNMTSQFILVDIGYGAAGSEQILIPDISVQYSSSEEIWHFGSPKTFDVDIPLGTRLAARMAKTDLFANHNVNLVGIPWR